MKIEELIQGQIVLLDWLDSTNQMGGWFYDEVVATPKEIQSVGFILDVSKNAVAISSTRSNSGGVIDPLHIPIPSITKITKFEV